jgi:2-oxoglutarate dehydrogenase E2 component (dihydrolipoamide succinyltransferase)
VAEEVTADEWIRFSPIRRRTAERMTQAHLTIPQVTTSMRVDYTRVQEARRAAGPEFRQQNGFSLTFLPFVARATADALRKYPYLNARVEGDGLRVLSRVDLGIAVDLDLQGLLVPVVRGADQLRLPALAERINSVARGARDKRLGVDDLTGSTFTITNPGAVGTLVTTPLVNPPVVGILSVEGIQREPVVVTTADGVEAFAVGWIGQLALSYDHRAVDGAYAAAFLAEIRRSLESRDWSAEV